MPSKKFTASEKESLNDAKVRLFVYRFLNGDRLNPDWKPNTAEQAGAIFQEWG